MPCISAVRNPHSMKGIKGESIYLQAQKTLHPVTYPHSSQH